MLKGISPLIGPELLDILYRMGHGDQLVLADARFPGETLGRRVIRADGLTIPALLDAILPLIDLDSYVEAPLAMMSPVPGDKVDPEVEATYRKVLERNGISATTPMEKIERFAFYERTRTCFAVVMSGDTASYGNLLLTKA